MSVIVSNDMVPIQLAKFSTFTFGFSKSSYQWIIKINMTGTCLCTAKKLFNLMLKMQHILHAFWYCLETKVPDNANWQLIKFNFHDGRSINPMCLCFSLRLNYVLS